MSSRSRNKSDVQDEILVKDLTARLLTEGEGCLNGTSTLILTASILDQLNQQFKSADHDRHDDIVEDPSTALVTASDCHIENVQYLYEFVKKVQALKVTNGCKTLQGNVNVGEFSSLQVLELKRIPIHLFVGLQPLRTRLKKISCVRCIHSLQDLFSTCGGDRSSSFNWPELISANLSFNYIENLDNSLKLVPMLVSLDLSHNSLKTTDSLELLSQLEYLNLSYNQLDSLPNISNRASVKLKVLSVRHNCIENLNALSSLTNLQKVDLAYNCLVEHSALQPIENLRQLKLICFEGNPLVFQTDYRKLCLKYIHSPSLTFVLDGKALNKGEVKIAMSGSRQQLSGPSNGFHALNRREINSSINSADVSTRQVGTVPRAGSSGQVVTDNQRNDSSIPSSCGNILGVSIGRCLTKNKCRRAPVTREVIIDEDIQTCDENGEDMAPDSSVPLVTSSEGGARRKSLGASQEGEDGAFRMRQEVAKCRQQLGNDWLSVGARLHLFPGSSPNMDPDAELIRMIGGTVPTLSSSSPRDVTVEDSRQYRAEGGSSNRTSQVSDEVIVLSTESAPPPPQTSGSVVEGVAGVAAAAGATVSVMGDVYASSLGPAMDCSRASDNFLWNQLSPNNAASSESEGELEDVGEERTFFVDMEKPGSTQPTSIILVVGHKELREKDSDTARTVERLDLKSICSVEVVESHIAVEGVKDAECTQIRVTFSYIRRDRRERLYTCLDSLTFRQLLNCLKPIADENTFEEMAVGALQCLKCSSQFSKEVAKKVVRKSQLSRDDVQKFSKSADTNKDFLSEANACPNCGSEMVIELADSALPAASSLTRTGAAPAALDTDIVICAPSPCNRSTPIPPSSSWSPVYTLGPTDQPMAGASCPTTSSNSKPETDDYASACSRCTVVQVEAEVHFPSSRSRPVSSEERDGERSRTLSSSYPPPGAQGLRRSESDITILSNPSQSSIQVVAPSHLELSALDAISESSNDFNWMLHHGKHDLSEGRSLLSESAGAIPPNSDVNSVGHSVTGYSLRSDTPESFLSAVSGSVEKAASVHRSIASADEAGDSDSRTAGGDGCSHSEGESTELVPEDQRGDSVSCDLDTATLQEDGADQQEVVTWSCRDATVKFSFQNFSQVDHRVQLYLVMHVLEPDDEVVALLRAGIVPFLKSEEWPGLLVFSKSKVYTLKITGPESDQPKEWLQKIGTFSCNSLMYVNVRLGSQCLQLEFGPKSSPSCFTVVFRDSDHCNNFVNFLTDIINSGGLDMNQSQVEFILDSDESLQTIRELLLLPCSADKILVNQSEKPESEIPIILYTMCYWMPHGGTSFEPISLVLTSADLHLFTENLHWPLPHLMVPSTEILSEAQLTPRDKRQIQDLISVEQVKGHFLELILKFWDEDVAEESVWRIAMETKSSLQTFINILKDPWEKLFAVDLQITIISES